MEQRIDILERDVREIKTELALIRSEYSRLGALEVRIERIELDIRDLRAESNSLRMIVSTHGEKLAALHVSVDNLRATVHDLNRRS